LEMAAELIGDGRTQLSILIPRREFTKRWHRLLHDHSSSSIATALADVPNCNVTFVPYLIGGRPAADTPDPAAARPATTVAHNGAVAVGLASQHLDTSALPADRARVAELVDRRRVTVAGRVRSVRVQPWSGTPSLECSLADETGSVTVVFFGRESLGGVRAGTVMSVTGVAGRHHGHTAILNPEYQIIAAAPAGEAPADHH